MNRAVFGIISVMVAAGCVRLGFWQLSRLDTRQALNAEVRAQLARPPVHLGAGDGDSVGVYRRVRAEGVYDSTLTVVEVLRARGGAPGVYLVSPLRLSDGRGVLVERGWVPSPDARTVSPSRYAWSERVVVEGFVTPVMTGGERPAGADSGVVHVRGADPVVWREAVSYPLLPILVRRTGGTDHPDLTPLDPPELTNGPHLSYAVQWFAFAVVAVVGTAVFLYRGRPARPNPGPARDRR